nr:Dyp-type peroxidase [Capsulimonas corticalis]
MRSTWMNIAFTFQALSALEDVVPGLLDTDFKDQAFVEGLAERSHRLGDAPGSPDGWFVGGERAQPLVIVQIASDTREDLATEVNRIEDSIYAGHVADGKCLGSGARITFKQNGANLPGNLSGHEHFGFLDGISQPGIRGLLSSDPRDVLTLRQNPAKRDQPSQNGQPGTPAQGKPGQDLLWSGEFVFGYPKQNSQPNADWDGPNPIPGPIAEAGPTWAKNGSFLVFRRLRQDVGGFHAFLKTTATNNNVLNPTTGSAPALVGSRLVGRWASGAPVLREPDQDNSTLGNDDCANNNFEFGGATANIPAPPSDPFSCTDEFAPPSPGDTAGQVCPFSAHIRKVYPRDDTPLQTGGYGAVAGATPPGCPANATLNEPDTQTHRLLRRGIPYGDISASTPTSPVDDNVDRGLLFFAYQTSIERQFEFVTRCWANNPDFKEPGAGVDPIIGQVNNADGTRTRHFQTVIPDANGTPQSVALTTEKDWVLPTGGGYFFSPSLSALRMLSGQV